jgi:hypothetical protein
MRVATVAVVNLEVLDVNWKGNEWARRLQMVNKLVMRFDTEGDSLLSCCDGGSIVLNERYAGRAQATMTLRQEATEQPSSLSQPNPRAICTPKLFVVKEMAMMTVAAVAVAVAMVVMMMIGLAWEWR